MKADIRIRAIKDPLLSVATIRDTYGLAAAEATIEVQAADIVDSFFLRRFGRGWFAANEYWTAIWHPDLVEAIKHSLPKSRLLRSIYGLTRYDREIGDPLDGELMGSLWERPGR